MFMIYVMKSGGVGFITPPLPRILWLYFLDKTTELMFKTIQYEWSQPDS